MGTSDGSRPNRIVWHEITCPICGETVRLTGHAYHYRKMQTCGRARCADALSRQRYPDYERTARLLPHEAKRLARHHESPASGPWETNSSASEWHLLGPDGTAYHFRNLALFLRSHPELFDPADVAERPSRRGVLTKAQGQLGKLRPERRQPRNSWKGWTWLTSTEGSP